MAERFNRTLLDKLLPSLFHASLPTRFRESCAHHVMLSYNLTPTQTNTGKSSPHSLWKNTEASYSALWAFGCKVFQMITGPTQGGKHSRKADPCLHLYSLPDGDGWMLWDIRLRREVKSHDVVFLENKFPGLDQPSKKTHQDWLDWSLDTTAPTSNPQSCSLWDRRLSASIHNPVNLHHQELHLQTSNRHHPHPDLPHRIRLHRHHHYQPSPHPHRSLPRQTHLLLRPCLVVEPVLVNQWTGTASLPSQFSNTYLLNCV